MENTMRWQREEMGGNSPICASAVKPCPACLHKPCSRLRAQVTAAEDMCVHRSWLAAAQANPAAPACGWDGG